MFVIVVTKRARHDVLLFDHHNLKLLTVSHAGYELVPTSDPPFLGSSDAFKIPTKTPNTTLLPIALAIQLVPTLALASPMHARPHRLLFFHQREAHWFYARPEGVTGIPNKLLRLADWSMVPHHTIAIGAACTMTRRANIFKLYPSW